MTDDELKAKIEYFDMVQQNQISRINDCEDDIKALREKFKDEDEKSEAKIFTETIMIFAIIGITAFILGAICNDIFILPTVYKVLNIIGWFGIGIAACIVGITLLFISI